MKIITVMSDSEHFFLPDDAVCQSFHIENAKSEIALAVRKHRL